MKPPASTMRLPRFIVGLGVGSSSIGRLSLLLAALAVGRGVSSTPITVPPSSDDVIWSGGVWMTVVSASSSYISSSSATAAATAASSCSASLVGVTTWVVVAVPLVLSVPITVTLSWMMARIISTPSLEDGSTDLLRKCWRAAWEEEPGPPLLFFLLFVLFWLWLL